jgi:F0F1-type ATP synthase delta subunit
VKVQELQPWLDPDQTIEALEILRETAECLRNTAQFASLRKELRGKLEQEAARIDEFVQRTKQGIVDPSVMLAMDTMAREKKSTIIEQVTLALETFISAHNRRNKQ